MKTDLTVSELVAQSSQHKVWLCPSISACQTFQTHPLIKGVECTKSTVPEKLKDMKIEKYFVEDGFLCIIWVNDGSLEKEVEAS